MFKLVTTPAKCLDSIHINATFIFPVLMTVEWYYIANCVLQQNICKTISQKSLGTSFNIEG